MSFFSTLLVIVAGFSLAMMVVLLTVASRSAREVRATIFPIVREEEAKRMRRARLGGLFSGVLAAVLAGAFFVSGQIAAPAAPGSEQTLAEAQSATPTARVAAVTENNPEAASETAPTPPVQAATATQIVEPSIEAAAVASLGTATQASAASETPTPKAESPAATVTATVTRTPEPSVTPIPPTPTIAASPQPVPAGVEMGPISFAKEIDDRRNPISPTVQFNEGIDRIYAVFPYSGMSPDLKWTQVWYYDGAEFARDEGEWEWGQTDRSYLFVKPVGAGDYKLDLYVNDRLMSSASFSIQGPTAVGGPEEEAP